MIREYISTDLESINLIGKLIKDKFNHVYDIEHFVNYDYAKVFIYEMNSKIVGFIQLELHFETIDIINIAVDSNYQNKGVGSALIQYVVKNIPGEVIKLEVKESNVKAIKTYEKNGFKEIARRKNYYGNEDAIIMERSLL